MSRGLLLYGAELEYARRKVAKFEAAVRVAMNEMHLGRKYTHSNKTYEQHVVTEAQRRIKMLAT